MSSSTYGELAPDPRSVLDLYELMQWAIPELAAVVDLHSRVIGFPEIETKDATFQKDWDDFVNGKRKDQAIHFGIGLNYYLGRTLKSKSN